MADDLDDLLDEVESKFCTNSKSSTTKQPSEPSEKVVTQTCQSSKVKKKDDLNDMINDIFDDDDDLNLAATNNRKSQPVSPQQSLDSGPTRHPSLKGGSKKCFPVFMGGTDHTQGIATAVNKRCCDNLRCTECDFSVSTFQNFKWKDKTDYLFLRNNMPDFDRLQPNLIPKEGCRAYACQCKWRNALDMTDLQRDVELRWFCGKH